MKEKIKGVANSSRTSTDKISPTRPEKLLEKTKNQNNASLTPFAIIIAASLAITWFAYIFDYDGVLKMQHGLAGIIVLMFTINVMGNLIQITVEIQKIFRNRKENLQQLKTIINETNFKLVKIQNKTQKNKNRYSQKWKEKTANNGKICVKTYEETES